MKFFKTGLLLSFVMTVAYLAYCWITYQPEEWQTKQRCKECTNVENGKLHNLKGTIEINENGIMTFTENKSKKMYTLLPCDRNCDNRLSRWFQDIGVIDIENNVPLYFRIEGRIDSMKQEFRLLNATLINEQNPINGYINISKIKGLPLEDIVKKYTPIHEEDFLLNEEPITEFRIGLYNFFNEQERLKPILIKEITWKQSLSKNYTIWFKKIDNKWIYIDSYLWNNSAEF